MQMPSLSKYFEKSKEVTAFKLLLIYNDFKKKLYILMLYTKIVAKTVISKT